MKSLWLLVLVALVPVMMGAEKAEKPAPLTEDQIYQIKEAARIATREHLLRLEADGVLDRPSPTHPKERGWYWCQSVSHNSADVNIIYIFNSSWADRPASDSDWKFQVIGSGKSMSWPEFLEYHGSAMLKFAPVKEQPPFKEGWCYGDQAMQWREWKNPIPNER